MSAPRYGPKKRLTLVVDGDTFDLVEGAGGSTYKWTSGPNKDYGFTTPHLEHSSLAGGGNGTPPPHPTQDHERKIRNFLQMIDPETGFIAED